MTSGVRNRVAQHESDGGSDDADQHSLGNKDIAYLGFLRAHRHQNGDVFGLLHHHHNERDENVESGDKDDESNGNERDHAFQAQGAKESLILLHPVGGHEPVTGSLFQVARDDIGFVNVVDFEFDHRNQVAEAKQLLRIRETSKSPAGVIVEK